VTTGPKELPRNVSPWTTRQKLGRLAWAIAQATVFRLSFHNWYRWRAFVLRSFGATVGRGVRVRRTVLVEIPWNLSLADDVIVGDGVILYALGRITIGPRAMVSQHAHLCAGSHDYHLPHFPLLRPPITVGADCWIAADAFVGPGVTVGDRAVVGARAAVFKDVPAGMVVGGNPARVIKARDVQP
jgi:putative colanic acid biosynthesis acetyltransferase WcaF